MTLSIELSDEQQAAPAEKARVQGLSAVNTLAGCSRRTSRLNG